MNTDLFVSSMVEMIKDQFTECQITASKKSAPSPEFFMKELGVFRFYGGRRRGHTTLAAKLAETFYHPIVVYPAGTGVVNRKKFACPDIVVTDVELLNDDFIIRNKTIIIDNAQYFTNLDDFIDKCIDARAKFIIVLG